MHTRRVQILSCLLTTAGLLAAPGSAAWAQTPSATPMTFDACYMEKTGVIYRIDPSGTLGGNLPTACVKDGKHIQFSWTDGEGADHSALSGLLHDDHKQYLLANGSRAATGSLQISEDKAGIVELVIQNRSTAAGSTERISFNNEDGAVAMIQLNDATNSAYPNVMTIGNNRPGGSIRLNTQGQPKLVVTNSGNVGVGTLTPSSKLSVAGVVESTNGGFKFPDGTTQTTAATGTGSDHGSLAGLVDDDHSQYLLTDGVRNATDGFAVTGRYGVGNIPTSGPGTRLMWYPNKAAFRAGSSVADEWDDAYVGNNSTATGLGTKAIGEMSVATGRVTTAAGPVSTAMGLGTTATGSSSTALGNGTQATGENSTATGRETEAGGDNSTAMGFKSTAAGEFSTAMGEQTRAIGISSTAMGLYSVADGYGATAMGSGTKATGEFSTAMGGTTTASGQAATALGASTTASGPFSTTMGARTEASGQASTAMGSETTASGRFTTAMGYRASTDSQVGSFVYGDNSTFSLVVAPAPNSFTVRAEGGTTFYSNAAMTAGVALATGAGAWANVSDRARKRDFREVDGEGVLAHIRDMPIQSWSYKSQDPSVRHVGPTAQDFYAAFSLGDDERTITTSDIDGVNMLAIQALERRTRDLQAENRALRERLEALEAALSVPNR